MARNNPFVRSDTEWSSAGASSATLSHPASASVIGWKRAGASCSSQSRSSLGAERCSCCNRGPDDHWSRLRRRPACGYSQTMCDCKWWRLGLGGWTQYFDSLNPLL